MPEQLQSISTNRIKHRGQWYVSVGTFASMVGVQRTLARRWIAPGGTCGWLGRGIVPYRPKQPIKAATLGRPAKVWLPERDALTILKAMESREDVPTIPGRTHVQDASKELGLSQSRLYQMLRASGLQSERFNGRGCDGRTKPRAYIPDWFVTEAKAGRLPQKPTDLLTVKEAAAILGCTTSNIHVMIDDGKLTALPGSVAVHFHRRRNGSARMVRGATWLRRSEVMGQIGRKRHVGADEPTQPAAAEQHHKAGGKPIKKGAPERFQGPEPTHRVMVAGFEGMAYRQFKDILCEHQKIHAADRTRPMSLKEAAKLMGFDDHKPLKRGMDEGSIPFEKIGRQQYVFARSNFIAEVQERLIPELRRTQANSV